jgi:DNA-binding transcriptional MerR regulator
VNGDQEALLGRRRACARFAREAGIESSAPIECVPRNAIRSPDAGGSRHHCWERCGLLAPHRRANRRFYDIDQLYRIALIKLWQATGTMTLDEITTLLHAHTGEGDWRETLHDRIEAVNRQLDQLRTARSYLAHLLGCAAEHGLERCGAFRGSVALPPELGVTSRDVLVEVP